MTRSAWSWGALVELGADRQLHLKGRAFAERRFHPDAPTVHLHDFLGDGEAQTRTPLSFGKRAVHLMKVLEDAGLVLFGNTWPRIGHADVEAAVDRFGRDSHLPFVGELDSVADEVEQYLGEALLITKSKRQGPRDVGAENEILVLG